MSSLVQACRENTLRTYLSLAKALPATTVQEMPGFILLSSPVKLTLCNMALGFEFADEEELRQATFLLRLQSESISVFRAFLFEGDRPENLLERFAEIGLRLEATLAQMACERSFQPAIPCQLASSDLERRQVSEFMVQQFSYRRDPQTKQFIAYANANSPHELWYLGTAKAPTAAMMLSESESAVGLYNLCVSTGHRRGGLGAGLFAFAVEIAQSKCKPLVFQTELGMKNWYKKMGSFEISSLKALGKSKISAII